MSHHKATFISVFDIPYLLLPLADIKTMEVPTDIYIMQTGP